MSATVSHRSAHRSVDYETALRFVSLSYTKLRPESVRLRYRLRLLPLASVTVALPKIKIQRGRHVAGTFVLLFFFLSVR